MSVDIRRGQPIAITLSRYADVIQNPPLIVTRGPEHAIVNLVDGAIRLTAAYNKHGIQTARWWDESRTPKRDEHWQRIQIDNLYTTNPKPDDKALLEALNVDWRYSYPTIGIDFQAVSPTISFFRSNNLVSCDSLPFYNDTVYEAYGSSFCCELGGSLGVIHILRPDGSYSISTLPLIPSEYTERLSFTFQTYNP